MPISVLDFLRHILDETKYLEEQSKTMSKNEFKQSETPQRAFVRSLEVIGEAAKKIPDDLKNKYSAIEWKKITGMRDVLIHDYFGVDYDIVWDVVTTKIPQLRNQIEQILEQETKK